MAAFIEKCSCAGARPVGVVGHRFYARPEITGRLLRDRHVARLLVAPTGSGKSTVAFEYAQIVFDFMHVFWIRCESPCFLRDLDAGTLLEALLQVDPLAKLAVLEDVPPLDMDRARAFGEFVDGLLDRECEVIATCTPSSDTFSHLMRGSIRLSADDLLLTDEELDMEVVAGRMTKAEVRALSRSRRVACLLWDAGGERRLLDGVRREDLPSDVKLAICAFLMLQAGNLDDLRAFISEQRCQDICSFVADGYPFVGIDVRTRTFDAVPVAPKLMSEALVQRIDELVSGSLYADRDALCRCFADTLLERGADGRACEFMMAYSTKQAAAAWLARRGFVLIDDGHPLPLCRLFDMCRRGAKENADALAVQRAWAAYQLEDAETAVLHARRAMKSSSASLAQKASAACIAAFASPDAEKDKAARFIDRLLKRAGAVSCADALYPHELDVDFMAAFVRASCKGGMEALRVWSEWTAGAASGERGRKTAMLCSGWLLASAVRRADDGGGLMGAFAVEDDDASAITARHEMLSAMIGFIDGGAVRASDGSFADWYTAFAANALFEAAERFPSVSFGTGGRAREAALLKWQTEMFEQREEYAKSRVDVAISKDEYRQTHPYPFRKDEADAVAKAVRTHVPDLHVTLFGGMEVRVGKRLVDPRLLSRTKTKTLLALLIVNRGRELERDRLGEMLWPDSSTESCRRNLYGVWSQLRQALTFDGSCPYLVKTQAGYRLDMRRVGSDVYAFEALCRSLTFGTDEAIDWERLYAQVTEDYSGKLMPCETQNGVIVGLREKYHTQLVDGLLSMSNRLAAMNEPRGALWFAREAYQRDDKREDVYVTLMEAQIASDQRASALETYFACRRFLNEDLGIDPSAHLVRLYRSIIETEAAF